MQSERLRDRDRLLCCGGADTSCSPLAGLTQQPPAQVWTYNKRAAFVLSVTEKGRPVRDNIKLQRLRQILFNLVDTLDDGIINIKTVRHVTI